MVPLLGLAPDGVCLASDVATGAVSSYLAFSPLPRLVEVVCFLWHFPSGHPAPPLAGVLPGGARTFLPPASSRRRAGRRSPGYLGLTPYSSTAGWQHHPMAGYCHRSSKFPALPPKAQPTPGCLGNYLKSVRHCPSHTPRGCFWYWGHIPQTLCQRGITPPLDSPGQF